MDIDVKKLARDIWGFAMVIRDSLYSHGVLAEVKVGEGVFFELSRGHSKAVIRIDYKRGVVELKIAKPRTDALGYATEDELLNFLYIIELAKAFAKAFAEELGFKPIPNLYEL